MIITLAQFNPVVGDLEGNFKKAEEIMKRHVAGNNVGIVVFPELAVTGYPPKDLLEKPAFVKAVYDYTADRWMKLSTEKTAILFGTVLENKSNSIGKPLRNAAILSSNKQLIGFQYKSLLPTYDVFDEARYFEPAEDRRLMEYGGLKLGVSICEDCWNDKEFWKDHLYTTDPMKDLAAAGCDIFINISASPYALGKPEQRAKMLSHIAKKYNKPLFYCNQVGGNDDVVYDGRSLVFANNGQLVGWDPPFRTNVSVFETESIRKMAPDDLKLSEAYLRTEQEEIFDALVLGTRDYAHKTGFTKALVGLSGGIDSAIVAVIAADALGPANVLGVAMPSKYSSDHSVKDAERIAKKLGIEFEKIPIKAAHSAYIGMLADRLGTDLKVKPWEENIQARARGATLMAVSNEENRLLLTTGNKSEVAVGYCTLYGDTCGGLAVISDVFKTKVYKLARWINDRRGEIIPKNSIEKPPSAELRPNQKDQDSLPPYDLLDQILDKYIEQQKEVEEIVDSSFVGYSPSRQLIEDIVRKVDRNEYKRKQLAPGLKITRKAFGTGRQMPIAQGWR